MKARLYRGQGVERGIDPRSTIGRYFTPILATAEAFAASQGGSVYFVEIEAAELPPLMAGYEYLLSREQADGKRPLV